MSTTVQKYRDSPDAAERLLHILNDCDCDLMDADDVMGETDCPDGCEVEPDGVCSHGWRSAGLTAGVI